MTAVTYDTSDNYPNPISDDERAKAFSIPFTENKPDAAEDIARVVESIRKGQVRLHRDKRLSELALESFKQASGIVDATSIYDDLISEQKLGKPVHFYEDHPSIAPPWEQAIIGYQNGHGNIILMDCVAKETDGTKQWDVVKRIEGDAEVEWERVRWRIDVLLWLGGQDHTGKRTPTTGPMHYWRLAVYENGEPADLSWVHIYPEYPMEYWDMAHATLLGSLNFMNCRNVEIIEPQRPRPQARRIARTGVRVSMLNVFPIGKSSRNGNKGGESQGVPLTSVRGHFATYGPEYGKGLLFGKIAGRFWIPQHARGDKAVGETETTTYVLKKDRNQNGTS